jgi:hypothetical protein
MLAASLSRLATPGSFQSTCIAMAKITDVRFGGHCPSDNTRSQLPRLRQACVYKQRHSRHKASLGFGQDRSVDGGIQCYRIGGNAPCIGAAERILDLDAALCGAISAEMTPARRRYFLTREALLVLAQHHTARRQQDRETAVAW